MLRPIRSSPSLGASAGVRLLTLVVAWTPLAVDVTQAQAVVPAPGFSSGPKVVSGGLLWAGDSAGQEDVFLSTATSTRLLVPDAELSAVNVDDGWVVVAEAWAQQNYAYTIQPEDPPRLACVREAPVGSPELVETPLSTVAPPIIVKATPGPRPVGLHCPTPK